VRVSSRGGGSTGPGVRHVCGKLAVEVAPCIIVLVSLGSITGTLIGTMNLVHTVYSRWHYELPSHGHGARVQGADKTLLHSRGSRD
jgi:hypothetical protein